VSYITTAPALKSEIRDDERKVDNIAHLTRLADGMTRNGQDVRDWAYTGEVYDAKNTNAACTCGHPIRWVFTIQNTKTSDILPIGSVCIGSSVPYLISAGNEHLAEALQAALAKLRADLAEAERRERDARNDVVVAELFEYVKALNTWRRDTADNEYRARRRFVPEHLYKPLRININSTPGRTASGAKKKITTFLFACIIEARTEGDRAKSFPAPPETVRDDIRSALRKLVDEHDAARVRAETFRVECEARAAAYRAARS
jgi:hypothetical protein